MAFKLNINGKSVSVDAPGDMPLLWALRDVLHMRGTKYGCGIGQCSACAVHIDGAPTRSCRVTISNAANKRVTTIEGLSPDRMNALQQAWIAEEVPQCGYCQSGQIMAAAALLAAKPKPTDTDIDAAMDSHICRCGTYERIRRAIHRAAGAPRTEAGR
jgi:aerobic-type carbon monoxide dehydrogenase small subunit (CoxS/CutS family)